MIAGEAVLTTVKAHAAPECVAGDANVGARTVQGRKAQIGRPWHDVSPQSASTNPSSARLGIDLYPAQAAGAQQHSIGERAKRCRIVPGALGGDSLAFGRG